MAGLLQRAFFVNEDLLYWLMSSRCLLWKVLCSGTKGCWSKVNEWKLFQYSGLTSDTAALMTSVVNSTCNVPVRAPTSSICATIHDHLPARHQLVTWRVISSTKIPFIAAADAHSECNAAWQWHGKMCIILRSLISRLGSQPVNNYFLRQKHFFICRE